MSEYEEHLHEAYLLPARSTQLDRARFVIQDIIDHATPLGEDEDGFVTTGYLVSVGSIHRALGFLRGEL